MNEYIVIMMLIVHGAAGNVYRIYMDPDPTAITGHWADNWIPTFEEYLNDAAKDTNVNATFELFAYDASVEPMSDLVFQNKIDFYYTQPTGVACVISQFDAIPIVTLTRFITGTKTKITAYGGAIVVRASEKRIQDLSGIKGAVVGMELPYSWAASLLQQSKLVQNGYDLYRDAKQVVVGSYTLDYEQLKILQDLLAERLDVAFLRADNLPSFVSQGLVNRSAFRVISRVSAMIPGTQSIYPFDISTQLHAEWGICAFPTVPPAVRELVAAALIALNASARPAVIGKYAGWAPPANYVDAAQVGDATRHAPAPHR